MKYVYAIVGGIYLAVQIRKWYWQRQVIKAKSLNHGE